MTLTIDSIVYDGSPFLPMRYRESLDKIVEYIELNRSHPAVAIAFVVGLIGVGYDALFRKDFEYLVLQFGLTSDNLSQYFFGFTTPPALVMGGHMLMGHPVRTVISALCPNNPDETMIRLNQYKMSLLHEAHRLFGALAYKTPGEICDPIWDLCVNRPFSDDIFFLAGVEASRRNYKGYATDLLKIHPNPA